MLTSLQNKLDLSWPGFDLDWNMLALTLRQALPHTIKGEGGLKFAWQWANRKDSAFLFSIYPANWGKEYKITRSVPWDKYIQCGISNNFLIFWNLRKLHPFYAGPHGLPYTFSQFCHVSKKNVQNFSKILLDNFLKRTLDEVQKPIRMRSIKKTSYDISVS